MSNFHLARAQPTVPLYSYAEYLERLGASQIRLEFVSGLVYAMAGGTPEHNRIVMRLTLQVGNQLAPPCEPYGSDQKVRTGAAAFFPDLIVVCGTPQLAKDDPNAFTNPTIVFEVLTAATDQSTKAAEYKTLAGRARQKCPLPAADADELDPSESGSLIVRDETRTQGSLEALARGQRRSGKAALVFVAGQCRAPGGQSRANASRNRPSKEACASAGSRCNCSSAARICASRKPRWRNAEKTLAQTSSACGFTLRPYSLPSACRTRRAPRSFLSIVIAPRWAAR